jgi:hypothetical protein
MGWFVYRAFRALRKEKAAGLDTAAALEEDLQSR